MIDHERNRGLFSRHMEDGERSREPYRLTSLNITLRKKNLQPPAKNHDQGVPVMAQWLTNPTCIHEDAGLIPSLAQGVKGLVLP